MADDLAEVSRICEKLVDDYPYLAFYRERLATSYMLRGELFTLKGQPEPATAELTKSNIHHRRGLVEAERALNQVGN